MYFNCLGLHTSSNVPYHKPVGFSKTKKYDKKQLKNALFTIHHLIRRALYCAWYARVSPVMYNGNKIMQFDLLIYIIKPAHEERGPEGPAR